MIDVGMTEDHAVNAPGVERELGVESMGLGPASLEQTGVEQDAGPSRLEQVHGSGDLAGAAPEGESGSAHNRTPLPGKR
jgi:hypothetical protein